MDVYPDKLRTGRKRGARAEGKKTVCAGPEQGRRSRGTIVAVFVIAVVLAALYFLPGSSHEEPRERGLSKLAKSAMAGEIGSPS